jgi:hypothetical protein
MQRPEFGLRCLKQRLLKVEKHCLILRLVAGVYYYYIPQLDRMVA